MSPPDQPADEPADGRVRIEALEASELAEGQVVARVVGGHRIVLVRHEGRVHALGGVCPHQGHDLGEGFLAEGAVVCNSHLWAFDLGHGRCTLVPGAAVPVHPAREEGGRILVDLPPAEEPW